MSTASFSLSLFVNDMFNVSVETSHALDHPAGDADSERRRAKSLSEVDSEKSKMEAVWDDFFAEMRGVFEIKTKHADDINSKNTMFEGKPVSNCLFIDDDNDDDKVEESSVDGTTDDETESSADGDERRAPSHYPSPPPASPRPIARGKKSRRNSVFGCCRGPDQTIPHEKPGESPRQSPSLSSRGPDIDEKDSVEDFALPSVALPAPSRSTKQRQSEPVLSSDGSSRRNSFGSLNLSNSFRGLSRRNSEDDSDIDSSALGALKKAFPDQGEHELSRFAAAKNTPQAAITQFQEHLKWRNDTATPSACLESFEKIGTFVRPGFGNNKHSGLPMLYIQGGKYDPNVPLEDYNRAVAHCVNSLFAYDAPGELSLLVDTRPGKGEGWHNPRPDKMIPIIKEINNLASKHYPGRVGHLILYPLPPLMIPIFNTIKLLLPEDIKSKFSVLGGSSSHSSKVPKSLHEYISRDNLPEDARDLHVGLL
jgi:hypothetical protein